MNSYKLIKKMQRIRVWYGLSAIEQALFYELINICNAKGWKEMFCCSNSTLGQALEISDKTMSKARNQLAKSGLISYRPGETRRQAGCYSLCRDLSDGTFLPEPEDNPVQDIRNWPADGLAETLTHPETGCHSGESGEADTEDTNAAINGANNGVTNGAINGVAPDYIKTKTKTKKTNKKECVRDLFEQFRKAYPGTKRGAVTEFRNFRKKHPDHQEVVELLMPALEKFHHWREERIRREEFVPHYPHLSTWINQRRWETEWETNQPESHEKRPPVVD